MTWAASKPAYVLHFDFFSNRAEAIKLLTIAQRAGAQAIVLVPPAKVWESTESLAALDAIIAEIGRRHLSLVFSRIDASQLGAPGASRRNALYETILDHPGVFPNGKPTDDLFCTTVGVPGYREWMEAETAFYARRYGKLRNLLGITLGAISETIVSQRGGFFSWMPETRSYELTQYTPEAQALWAVWLANRYSSVEKMNVEFQTRFSSFDDVPLPKNEADPAFGAAPNAYRDFCRCINDWMVDIYESCRKIWHAESGREDVPFIWHFSGYDAEKFTMSRHSFRQIDLQDWMNRADAVGLSIYTNSGYTDLGHDSIAQMVEMAVPFARQGKKMFVMEGGTELPTPVLDEKELTYFATVAEPLHPLIYAYEFLKDPFYVEGEKNSGRLVDGRGRVRKKVFLFMRGLMKKIAARP